MPGVPDHVEKSDGAGPALRSIHPVSGPGILAKIAVTPIPNIKTVEGVIENGQPDTKQLKTYYEREAAEQFNLFCVSGWASSRKCVGNEMFDEESADGNDTAKRVQTAQPKRISLARTKRSHATFDRHRSCRTGSCRHRVLLISSSMKAEPFIMLWQEKGSQGTMKTIGMIGGIGPESTIEYYRLIIASYLERITDGSYPLMIINSIDLQKLRKMAEESERAEMTEYLVSEIQKLARAGSEFGFLAANTPHMVFDEIRIQSPIPLISIVEATCRAAKAMGLEKLGLFGTRMTMQGRFYPDVFSREGIMLFVP